MGSTNRRGRQLYDRWSRHLSWLRLLYGVVFLGRERYVRRQSIDALELEPGERVLELGCGSGNSFAALRRQVGESGRVVGLDYSSGMVNEAADRIEASTWENVHVVVGDAAQPGLEAGSFDAVYSAMAVSAMKNAESTLQAARACLRDDGRIVILDARPFQAVPWTLLNPVIVPIAKRLTNWFPAIDLPGVLKHTFRNVSISEFNGGSIFIARSSLDPETELRGHSER